MGSNLFCFRTTVSALAFHLICPISAFRLCLMCFSPGRTVERRKHRCRVSAIRSHHFGHDRLARSRRVDSRIETTADPDRYADFKDVLRVEFELVVL